MKSNTKEVSSRGLLMFPFLVLGATVMLLACNSGKPSEKDIVKAPELLEDRIRRNIGVLLDYASENEGRINDSTIIAALPELRKIYERNRFGALWAADGSWSSLGDSLIGFVDASREYGLFPSDYYQRDIANINLSLRTDSLSMKDAALWSRADLLLTSALMKISRDLRRGRLPYDSLNLRKDTPIIDADFYLSVVDSIRSNKQLVTVLQTLEPRVAGYGELKKAIRPFLDSASIKRFTYLIYPYSDTLSFLSALRQRLLEEKIFDSLPSRDDSAALKKAISSYQAQKKLNKTGRINEATVNSLNDTDWERFKRIALSLDKYKLMPDSVPQTYVWVNIPGYQLTVYDADTVVMESKVIVGASKTKTPELSSEISNFITYPQWTVPYSIIFKEMLPQIKKDTNYLKKQNLMVVDRNDSVIPPSKINWSKLSKDRFPYLIRQREGDDNSLGVIKFNFRNKYSVYLHDTNARWLFSKTNRALSHGCVRVQDWRELAHFLVRQDSVKYHPDTLARWIVRQEKHVVSGFKKVPVYIRYFTCAGKYGRMRFYDDIYGEDRILTRKYFDKSVL